MFMISSLRARPILTLALLVLLAALAPAQATARMVFDDGSTVTIDGGPTSIQGLTSFRVPGALVIHLDRQTHYQGETGQPIYFQRLEASGSYLGAGWKEVIGPSDPRRKTHWWDESLTHHMIVPGEWIPVFDTSSRWSPPSKTWADAIWWGIAGELDQGLFNFPRFQQALDQWGDETPLDLAHVHREWGKFFGGPSPRGWYESWHLRGDGYSNEHYDDLLWMAVKWLQTRRDEDWYFMVQVAVAHACGGIVHSTGSRFDGMPRYEKSGEDPVYGPRIVGGDNNPSHAKKWLRGLVLVGALSQNPIIERAVHERIDRLKRDTPRGVWVGSWGARIAARHLDDLYVAWVRTREPGFRQLAQEAIDYWITLVDPQKGYWINISSPNTTSPWMNAELVAAMLRWTVIGVGTAHRDAILDVGAATWTQGTDEFEGDVRSVRYRFFGPEAMRGHMSLLGYMIPMLRAMAREREVWTETYLAHRTFLAEHVGVSWGQPVKDPVTYRYAPQGSGNAKALKQTLAAALR